MTEGTSLRVLLAGGGTAGHVNPLLAVANELRAMRPDAELLVLGTNEGLERELVPASGFPFAVVPKVPLPRRPSPDILRLPSRLKDAIAAAENAIDQVQAHVVVGFGGYVSTPAYFAARRRNVPIVIHEGNARAGLANRLGSRYTEDVATTFPNTKIRHGRVLGMPLRHEIVAAAQRMPEDREAARVMARHRFELAPDKPTLLVTGGSLGAQRLNEVFAQAGPVLVDAGIQIIHITGRDKATAVLDDVADLPGYMVHEYLTDMVAAYDASDVVVCRSGAGTVSELAVMGKPSILVPLPIGNGEQRLNAAELLGTHACVIVDDNAITPQWATRNVMDIILSPSRLIAMGHAALSVARPHATEQMAAMIIDVAVRGARG